MPNEIERRVLSLLRGGHALPKEGRRAIIRDLGSEELAVLRRVARGEVPVEDARLRRKAVEALGFDDSEAEQSREALAMLVRAPDASLGLSALRALARLEDPDVVEKARSLVRDAATRPDLALGAARIAAQAGGDAVVAELQALRERLLRLVPEERSPSIQSLDRLIARARGEGRETGGGPRPVV